MICTFSVHITYFQIQYGIITNDKYTSNFPLSLLQNQLCAIPESSVCSKMWECEKTLCQITAAVLYESKMLKTPSY